MSASSDLESLARRFLDLWQEQVAAMFSAPALAEWAARALSPLGTAPGGERGVGPASHWKGSGPGLPRNQAGANLGSRVPEAM